MIEIRTAAAGRGAAWFFEGFNTFKKNMGTWTGIGLMLVIISAVALMLPFAGLALQLLLPVLMGGLLLGCKESAEGGQIRLNHLFAGFGQHTGNLVLLGLLYIVAAGIIMALLLTMAILAVGGSVILSAILDGNTATVLDNLLVLVLVMLAGSLLYLPLIMAFWFGPALIVFQGHGALIAMKYSFLGCLKNLMAFTVYGLIGLVLAVLATIPFMLGWIILLPVTLIGFYIAYRDIYAPDTLILLEQMD